MLSFFPSSQRFHGHSAVNVVRVDSMHLLSIMRSFSHFMWWLVFIVHNYAVGKVHAISFPGNGLMVNPIP